MSVCARSVLLYDFILLYTSLSFSFEKEPEKTLERLRQILEQPLLGVEY
jgi:hypothetical protein